MTPDLCAQHARVLFKKDTGYSNKTDKELDKEICESLIGTTVQVIPSKYDSLTSKLGTQQWKASIL
jgi:hypothetical protein